MISVSCVVSCDMHDTMGDDENDATKPPRRGKKKARVRRALSITLSYVAYERIHFLARQQGTSCSGVVEDLVAHVDYPSMFELFEQGARLAQIVIITRQPPAIVRAIYTEYLATRDEKAPVTLPQALPAPTPRAPATLPRAANGAAPRRLGPARS
jgi:hypothetical protein